MRPSSLAFAAALAVALPSGVALLGVHRGDDVANFLYYAGWCGAGLALGMILMAVIDLVDYLRGREVEIEDHQLRNWHSRLAAEERQQRLATPVASFSAPATPPDTAAGWRTALETFLLAGDVGGFSARRMAGVVGSDTWPMMTKLLEDAGILSNQPGRGYGWAVDMTLARALTKLRVGAIPLPDGPPPVVNLPVNTAATRRATPSAATVVNGTSRPVD